MQRVLLLLRRAHHHARHKRAQLRRQALHCGPQGSSGGALLLPGAAQARAWSKLRACVVSVELLSEVPPDTALPTGVKTQRWLFEVPPDTALPTGVKAQQLRTM